MPVDGQLGINGKITALHLCILAEDVSPEVHTAEVSV